MEPNELLRLLEAGDLYGLMLRVGRAWAVKYHPEAKRATLYVVEDEDAEPTRIRVFGGAAA